MKIKITRKGSIAYAELPQEFADFEEIEAYKLKDGYYLLSVPIANIQEVPASQQPTAQQEQNILKKLLSVKFQERTPDNVDRIFTAPEKEILRSVVSRKIVTVFKSAKYPQGVYNIDDRAFSTLRNGSGRTTQTASPARNSWSMPVTTAPPTVQRTDKKPETISLEKGYAIIRDGKEAFEVSDRIKKSGKANTITGIKGFDGRFYVAEKKYVLKLADMLRKIGTDEVEIDSTAKKLGVDSDGLRTVMVIMADQGEAIEKKKGLFVLL